MSINPSEVTKLLKDQLVMELHEYTVWTMFKLEKW